MNENPYRSLLRALVGFSKDYAASLRADTQATLSDEDVGRQLMIYSFLSCLRNEAIVLGIELRDIDLQDFDPDTSVFT